MCLEYTQFAIIYQTLAQSTDASDISVSWQLVKQG